MEAVADEPKVETEVAVETPPIPAPPPADCPPHVREHYEAICVKEREVRDLEGKYLTLKEESGEAKKDFEAADRSLRNLIASGADPQLKLPLADEPKPEAWRAAPFAELGLTAKQNELFESTGVTTIGGIEDLRAQIADGKASWPKGIGPAKVTDIENRIISWLDKNRDKFGEEAANPAPAADGGIESITFSSPGRESVTITADSAKVLKAAIIKAKSNGKAKSKAKRRK